MAAKQRNAGIIGLGVSLPPNTRSNDYWSKKTIDAWSKRLHSVMPLNETALKYAKPGVRKSLEAMLELGNDPFQGCKTRPIRTPQTRISDFELEAIDRCLEMAGVPKDRVDALLSFTTIPEFLGGPQASVIQDRLGLRNDCFVLTVDAQCDSFLKQLVVASNLIASGDFDSILLVQSTGHSHLVPDAAPYSAWVGDAATAVLVAPVSENTGVLGFAHGSNGALCDALVYSVPGKETWTDNGPIELLIQDAPKAAQMWLTSADLAKHLIDTTLEKTGTPPDAVDFYAPHQPTLWFRRVSQEVVGLTRAKSVDTYADYGAISACTIPLGIQLAKEQNLLRHGDLVVSFSIGSGQSSTAVLYRWCV